MRPPASRWLVLVLLSALAVPHAVAAGDGPRRTDNVIVVTLDGFRWQELFSGADETLGTDKAGGARDAAGLRKRYLRESAAERRAALLPFLWGTVARDGQ